MVMLDLIALEVVDLSCRKFSCEQGGPTSPNFARLWAYKITFKLNETVASKNVLGMC